MDSTIQDLIIGVVSNGLWSLISNAGGTTVRVIKEHISNTDVVTQAMEAAIASLAKDFPLGSGPERARLLQFLKSPETESVVRQLYATRLVGKEITSDVGTESIRHEFLTLVSLHLDVPINRIEACGNALFQALIAVCGANLEQVVGQGSLGAHEALSRYRQQRLLDELAAVQRNLAVLVASGRPDVAAVLAFEEKYRAQVGSRHSYIQPPHFDGARKVPIDELFVTPKFYKPNSRKRFSKSSASEIDISEMKAHLYRLVIVGNPGGGKSTLANKLVHDMAARYRDRPVGGRQLTPVLIVLREYGRLKKLQNCSILQFIELQANASYQVQSPTGAFEYLLLNGRVLVVFDGLDELLDTSYRQEISADVESFCSLYPTVSNHLKT